jgi:lipopolysaccharide transport system permease protein
MAEGTATEFEAGPSPGESPGSALGPSAPGAPVLELGPRPAGLLDWLREMWSHREVTYVLARKDFHVRYKRASLGVLWAVAVPLLQAAVLIAVFSKIIHVQTSVSYGAYVLSGVLPWTYFSITLPAACTAIVDSTSFTDKVWFPRAILPIVPSLSGLVGLGISMVLLLIGVPVLGASLGARALLLIPACLLLFLFTTSLGLVTSALQVYFRDVRFIVNAALMVWLYATPIMYPQYRLGHLGPYLDWNPLTGVITLFHLATVGQTLSGEGWQRPVLISVAVTAVLLIFGIEAQRRKDRLFVDLL